MASLDNFYVATFVFMLAVVMVAGLVFWNSIKSNVDLFEVSDTTRAVRSNAQSFYDSLDNVFVLAFFGLHLGILVTAFLLRSHPIIYVACILTIAILAVFAAPLSNAYESFINESQIAPSAASLTMTNFLMTKLPMIEVIIGFITTIVLAGLAKSEGII